MNRTLILASESPRRAALLTQLGVPFRAESPKIDETLRTDVRIEEAVCDVAKRKLEAVAKRLKEGQYFLAADTIVLLESEIIGKPKDAAEAEDFLTRLQGRAHRVLTGLAARGPKGGVVTESVWSIVQLAEATPAQVKSYVATGEPIGKAGAYAIQGQAAAWVRRVDGDHSNIVGLPLRSALRLLGKIGFPLPEHLRVL